MSHRALQRTVVRLLHDPTLVERLQRSGPAALEEPELVVPPRPLPFPVLWQLRSHPSEQVSLPAPATPPV